MAKLPFTMTTEIRKKLTEKAPEWTAKYPKPGDPKLYLIIDSELPCKWLVLYGWFVSVDYVRSHYPVHVLSNCDALHGDVVFRGPAGFEHDPQFCDINDNVYLIGYFSYRTYQEI